ncbi:MAG: hypothetical protein HQL35_15445 [Alphaproteobacteria bacterium]|nr:hypothetical protein [Alphaproteobacteria bacterium]
MSDNAQADARWAEYLPAIRAWEQTPHDRDMAVVALAKFIRWIDAVQSRAMPRRAVWFARCVRRRADQMGLNRKDTIAAFDMALGVKARTAA